jgi:endonuclease I
MRCFPLLFTSVFLFVFQSLSLAQIPEYYSGLNFSVTGEPLKLQLMQLIQETHQTDLVYTPGVWNALKLTDVDPTNPNRVLLIYGFNDGDNIFLTDRTRNINATCHSGDCVGLWNREHVYPRSLGTPNLGFEGPGSDAHNLRASDAEMNSARGNKRFTQGSGNAVILGNFFYPGDEWRGDVARMMMYMYLRYSFQSLPNNVGSGSSNMSPLGDMPNIFLQWNAQDPVSSYELQRNEVLQNLQGNRNPFIDNPYLATLIWNGPQAEDRWQLLSQLSFIETSVTVFPTFTYDYVTIASDINLSNYTTLLYTIQGQKVMQAPFSERIDISQYPAGMYILEISNGLERKSYKITRL